MGSHGGGAFSGKDPSKVDRSASYGARYVAKTWWPRACVTGALTPEGLIEHLKLRRPIYRKTAAHGHFGRNEPTFTWERTDKARGWARGAGVGGQCKQVSREGSERPPGELTGESLTGKAAYCTVLVNLPAPPDSAHIALGALL